MTGLMTGLMQSMGNFRQPNAQPILPYVAGLPPGVFVDTISGQAIRIVGLYDWYIYDMINQGTSMTDAANLIFFSVPVSSTKSLRFTNLQQASTLPVGWEAFVYKVRIVAPPDTTLADLQIIQRFGLVEFTIGQSELAVQYPMLLAQAGTGINGSMALMARTDAAATAIRDAALQLGSQTPAGIPPLLYPLVIAMQQTIQGKVTWLVPSTQTLGAARDIFYALQVALKRPANA